MIIHQPTTLRELLNLLQVRDPLAASSICAIFSYHVSSPHPQNNDHMMFGFLHFTARYMSRNPHPPGKLSLIERSISPIICRAPTPSIMDLTHSGCLTSSFCFFFLSFFFKQGVTYINVFISNGIKLFIRVVNHPSRLESSKKLSAVIWFFFAMRSIPILGIKTHGQRRCAGIRVI